MTVEQGRSVEPRQLAQRRLEVAIAVPLRDFTLRVELSAGNETVALLGPSGAGKTTTLMAVAGLVTLAQGRITLGDRVLFDAEERVNLPPEERDLGLVMQDFALFPHFSVFENVAFGLRCRRVPEHLLRERVQTALAAVGLAHLAGARPAQLSGGEQQRVALARAMVLQPAAMLLDEPLSALDPQTRRQVRRELRDLLDQLAIPVLLVTHDQEDADALAHRTVRLERR